MLLALSIMTSFLRARKKLIGPAFAFDVAVLLWERERTRKLSGSRWPWERWYSEPDGLSLSSDLEPFVPHGQGRGGTAKRKAFSFCTLLSLRWLSPLCYAGMDVYRSASATGSGNRGFDDCPYVCGRAGD